MDKPLNGERVHHLPVGVSSRQSSSESTGGLRAEGNGVRRIIDVQVDITTPCDQVTPLADGFYASHYNLMKQDSSCAGSVKPPRKDFNCTVACTDAGDATSLTSSFHSDKPEESPFSKPVFNRPTQYLKWHVEPKTVLVMVKVSDHDYQKALVDVFMDMTKFLIEERALKVYVEEWLCRLVSERDENLAGKLNAMPPVDLSPAGAPHIPPCISELLCYETGNPIDALADIIDLIVCLGGDGTLLHANSLFQKIIPPVLPFYAGSLGFLMTLSTNSFRKHIDDALTGNVRLTLRSRFCCVILKKDKFPLRISSTEDVSRGAHSRGAIPLSSSASNPTHSALTLDSIIASHTVMNEVVVDRGQSPFLTHLDLFADNLFLTTVQADGIIIATPTGSTAYSMAAGGSMVHPSVPCIIVTPICAHSLSFRPIILPANMEVRIAISEGSRSRAYVSFDGRNRRELAEDECLRVVTSEFPVPTIMASDQTGDWFHSLSHCLHWNVRALQGTDVLPGRDKNHKS